MIKGNKKILSQREKELFVGNLVTWGSIVTTLALAIYFSPVRVSEPDQTGASPQTQAVVEVILQKEDESS